MQEWETAAEESQKKLMEDKAEPHRANPAAENEYQSGSECSGREGPELLFFLALPLNILSVRAFVRLNILKAALLIPYGI
jgi:hypothetical protein